MTVASTVYLNWAIGKYHDLRCDLASSGTPGVSAAEVGAPAAVDDFARWGELAGLIAEREGWGGDEVTASSGATGAVTLACAALLAPGDRALVETPVYEPLAHIPAGFGAAVDRFERREAAGWRLEPDVVAAALRPGTKLVIATEPNNPTGAYTPAATIAAVAEVVRRSGARLLINEVYHRFHGTPSCRRADREILIADSVTKFEGMGWARGGWFAGPPEIVRRARDAQVTLSVLAPSSAAWARRALTRPELAERARRAASAEKRAIVSRWVAGHPRLSWVEPAAGIFGLIRVAEPPDLLALAERLLAKHGLLFAPGHFFGAPGTMRLSWSADEGCLRQGLEILGAALQG